MKLPPNKEQFIHLPIGIDFRAKDQRNPYKPSNVIELRTGAKRRALTQPMAKSDVSGSGPVS